MPLISTDGICRRAVRPTGFYLKKARVSGCRKARRFRIAPSGGDDTAAIQAAIGGVSAMPLVNGFLYWGALNCHVKWHPQFPPELVEGYRFVFTHANNYKGRRITHETWLLLENPWMRQEWNGNLSLMDGLTTRVYDVNQWHIHEIAEP
jgi:hypothetical protein